MHFKTVANLSNRLASNFDKSLHSSDRIFADDAVSLPNQDYLLQNIQKFFTIFIIFIKLVYYWLPELLTSCRGVLFVFYHTSDYF